MGRLGAAAAFPVSGGIGVALASVGGGSGVTSAEVGGVASALVDGVAPGDNCSACLAMSIACCACCMACWNCCCWFAAARLRALCLVMPTTPATSTRKASAPMSSLPGPRDPAAAIFAEVVVGCLAGAAGGTGSGATAGVLTVLLAAAEPVACGTGVGCIADRCPVAWAWAGAGAGALAIVGEGPINVASPCSIASRLNAPV